MKIFLIGIVPSTAWRLRRLRVMAGRDWVYKEKNIPQRSKVTLLYKNLPLNLFFNGKVKYSVPLLQQSMHRD